MGWTVRRQGGRRFPPEGRALEGYWSRRITDEHRIVYKVEEESLLLAQLRLHY